VPHVVNESEALNDRGYRLSVHVNYRQYETVKFLNTLKSDRQWAPAE